MTTLYFHGIWSPVHLSHLSSVWGNLILSPVPDNLLQLQSLPSPCQIWLRSCCLLILLSLSPSALLVCLLHPSIYIGKKMYVARGMDCSSKICTTPSLVGVWSQAIARLAENNQNPLLCCRLGKISSSLRQQLGKWSWHCLPSPCAGEPGLGCWGSRREKQHAVKSTAGSLDGWAHVLKSWYLTGTMKTQTKAWQICRKITNFKCFYLKSPDFYISFLKSLLPKSSHCMGISLLTITSILIHILMSILTAKLIIHLHTFMIPVKSTSGAPQEIQTSEDWDKKAIWKAFFYWFARWVLGQRIFILFYFWLNR